MIINIKGVKNARDFSEFGHKDCIRSASLYKLTKRGAKTLREVYGVKTVIDLRTDKEISEKPDAKIKGVKYIHIPIFNRSVPGISHESETDRFGKYFPEMKEMYRLLSTEKEYTKQFKKALKIIADPNRKGGVLWHCTEGKDRCGILSALFLLTKGVPREEIISDYLLTNLVNEPKANKMYYLMRLARRDREFAEKVRLAFLAKREYLEPVLDSLEEIAQEFK